MRGKEKQIEKLFCKYAAEHVCLFHTDPRAYTIKRDIARVVSRVPSFWCVSYVGLPN